MRQINFFNVNGDVDFQESLSLVLAMLSLIGWGNVRNFWQKEFEQIKEESMLSVFGWSYEMGGKDACSVLDSAVRILDDGPH